MTRVVASWLLVACACQEARQPNDWYSQTRELYFHIPVTVRFTPADPALAARVWSMLESVDGVFNAYRADSELGRLNAGAGTHTRKVSEPLVRAIRLSGQVSRLTNGAFDVSVRPLVLLWKQAAKVGLPPTDGQIRETRARCGVDKLSLAGESLSLTVSGMALDFGGIVKGMAVDWAIDMLRAASVRAALVQVGGETGAFGLSPRGRAHVIGIQHPIEMDKLWTQVVDPGTGLSVSTSGNYHNPIRIGDRDYYHIVDPRTGQPVDTHVLSVSILFPEAGRNGLADGLSTAGAVLGPDATLKLVTSLGGQALVLVRGPDGGIAVHQTAGFDSWVAR